MAADTVAEVPPPLKDLPTAKEKKYDRQLRLWGATGQIALEESHVLVINNGSGVASIETLKNLVLPGLGQFSVLDSAIVQSADLGVNFFLEDSSLGKFRAEETVKYLLELNPGVRGYAVTEPVESFIQKESNLSLFNLIIVSAPIDPSILSTLQKHAQRANVALFYLHCVGFYSAFSVSLPPAFPIVDTHPDPTTTSDLRLLSPWPALIEFAASKTTNLGSSSISQHEKGHIPWICLVLHYLEEWKKSHDGQIPSNYKQKSEFRELVRAGDANEENFDEACANVLKGLNPATIPSAVKEILSAPEAQTITADTPAFWVIAKAVQQFAMKHGELPLAGSVPDLKAQSADYIQLQNIYKQKARDDYREVLDTVVELQASVGRHGDTAIDPREVENFCKGATHIQLVRGRSFPPIQTSDSTDFGDRAKALAAELTNPESMIGLHLAFFALDAYASSHQASAGEAGGQAQYVPGVSDEILQHDIEKVEGIAHKYMDDLINQAGTFVENPEYDEIKANLTKICTELVRAGGGELHNIASLTGGLLAQEVIKVITRQYVPVDNTCLFDGVASKTYVLRQ